MEKNKQKYGYLIVFILFLGLVIGNYFQYQLSPLAPRLMESLNLTPVQFSSAFSAPMIPAIFLGIVIGVVTDRLGVKKVTTVGMIIMTIGLLARPFATGYTSFFITMFLAGFGTTFLNVNMSKIIGGWFPVDKVGPIMGMTMIGCTLGMTLGTGTTAFLPSTSAAFWLAGIVSVIVLLLWIIFMKDGQNMTAAGGSDAVELPTVKQALLTAIKSRNIWLVGICLLLLLGCNVCLTAFLPTALQSRGISEASSGLITMALTIGNLLGSFLGTALMAKVGRMKPFLIGFGILAGLCTAFAWSAPVSIAVIALFLTGFSFGTLVPTYMSFPALLPEIGPLYAGSAGGVIATIELIGAVVIPTYIVTPIAGMNFTLYFIMAGATMILMALTAAFLPELYKA